MENPPVPNIQHIGGQLDASGVRVAIVASRFNSFIVDRLVEGAIDVLSRTGGKAAQITVVHCPGAFEIPALAKRCAHSGSFDAVIVSLLTSASFIFRKSSTE